MEKCFVLCPDTRALVRILAAKLTLSLSIRASFPTVAHVIVSRASISEVILRRRVLLRLLFLNSLLSSTGKQVNAWCA